MAAAECSSFLDATLCGAVEDVRLPSTMRADHTPTFATDRVVPLLMRDVMASMQVRQRLHLRLLSESLSDLLEHDDTTLEEFEMLLVMLFSFVHRRGGLTPLQKKHNNETSDLAFSIVHRLLGTVHGKAHLVFEALRSVCQRLGCVHNALPPQPPPMPQELVAAVDTVAGMLPAAEAAIAKAAASVDRLRTSNVVAVCEGSKASGLFPHAPPYAYSIDALPPADRRGITDLGFTEAVAAFGALAPMETDDGTLAKADERDLSEVIAHGGYLGPRYVSVEQVNKLRHSVEGGSTLLDVLRFLYPLVPDSVLLKRIHGVRLVHVEPPCAADADAGPGPGVTPTASVVAPPSDVGAIVVSDRLLYGHKLSMWLQSGRPHTDRCDAVHWVVRWFQDVDFVHSGFVPTDAIAACAPSASSTPLNPWEQLMHEAALKLRKSRLSVFDVIHQAFPGDLFPTIKEHFTLVLRTAEKTHAAAVKYKQERTTAYKLALVKYCDLHEGGPNPSGDHETALTLADNAALAEIDQTLHREVIALHDAELAHAKACFERTTLLKQREAALAAQQEDLRTAQRALVEPIAGPEAPPVLQDIAGFRVNRAILELDAFQDDAAHRGQVMDILAACDRAGVPAPFLSQDAATAHLLLPRGQQPHCSVGFVYRDFAFSSPRPPIGRPWKGEQRLRIVTNIAINSDVKYRFMFEGYNFGTNTVIHTLVVGHASKSLSRVGSLEVFGWPDGWDRSSVVHYAGGFETLTQRYNENGVVVMDVEAHSLSKVGFSASVWLCVSDYGTDYPVALEVQHV